jgi:hypothetical protein
VRLEEHVGIDVEGGGELLQGREGREATLALQHGDVADAEVGPLGELLLRVVTGDAKLEEVGGNDVREARHGVWLRGREGR